MILEIFGRCIQLFIQLVIIVNVIFNVLLCERFVFIVYVLVLVCDKNLINFILKLFFVYIENVKVYRCSRSIIGKKRLCRSDNIKQIKVIKYIDCRYDSVDLYIVKGL